MQTQKEVLRQAILAAAKREFLDKGFENASIRTVALMARTSKSNLANYFSDKDSLFCALTALALEDFQRAFSSLSVRGNSPYTQEAQLQAVQKIMIFAFSHREPLYLLLFRSGGSSQKGFRDEAVRSLAELLWSWSCAYAPNAAVTELFVLSVARFYLGAIEEMLLKDYSAEQAALELPPFLAFVYGGWRTVFGEQKNKE